MMTFWALGAISTTLATAQTPEASPEAVSPPAVNQLDDLAARRDPFKRPDLAPKVDASLTELETFATLEYRMVGVVAGGPRTRAMLLGPNGKTYFVKKGDKIGIQKGVIEKITADGLWVRERVANVLGAEEIALTEIRLPTETSVSSVRTVETGTTDVEYQQTVESLKRAALRKAMGPSAAPGPSEVEAAIPAEPADNSQSVPAVTPRTP